MATARCCARCFCVSAGPSDACATEAHGGWGATRQRREESRGRVQRGRAACAHGTRAALVRPLRALRAPLRASLATSLTFSSRITSTWQGEDM
jgi:hypothetical protein